MSFNGNIADEREVLSICLDLMRTGERQVVSALTRQGTHGVSDEEQTLEYIRENLLAEFSEETLADFLAKNRERYPIDPDLNPEGRLICLTDEDTRSIFRDRDGWNGFYQEFPKSSGKVGFSRVGFNQDVTQALVYAGKQFHWLGGSGGCWIFSKPDETWTKKGLIGLWIS